MENIIKLVSDFFLLLKTLEPIQIFYILVTIIAIGGLILFIFIKQQKKDSNNNNNNGNTINSGDHCININGDNNKFDNRR